MLEKKIIQKISLVEYLKKVKKKISLDKIEFWLKMESFIKIAMFVKFLMHSN